MNKLILWRDVAPRLKSDELKLINFENGFTIFPYISLIFFLLFSEKCQNLRIKSYPYSNTDNCRAHWACNFGKATTTCCPEGFRYVPYRSCVEDLKCKDICPPTFHQEGQCDIRLILQQARQIWAVRRRFRVGWKRTALRTRNSNWPYHVQVLTTNRKT